MKLWTQIILLATSVFVLQGSEKKGVVHWAPSYMCDDFKVLDNVAWWHDFRMNLDYFHKHDICNKTIDNYKFTHVPMVWGYWGNTKIRIADEAHAILSFNEPNHKSQSNMTPKQAADAWADMERNSKGKPLVSPSASVCGKDCIDTNIEWFDEFFRLCKDCRVDYLATHAYVCSAGHVMKYLKKLYERYGRKIWLTEFACSQTTNVKEQLKFMKEILPELEAADFIYRYSWYAARLTETGFITESASLLEPDRSKLTKLGRFYNEFQGRDKDEPKPTKPSIEETTPNPEDPSIAGEAETLLILQSFTSNPTKWKQIIRFMKKNTDKLPEVVAEQYKSASKKKLKRRIKEKFTEVMCAELEDLQNEAIRERVEAIQQMPESGKKNGKKKKRRLGVPLCSEA